MGRVCKLNLSPARDLPLECIMLFLDVGVLFTGFEFFLLRNFVAKLISISFISKESQSHQFTTYCLSSSSNPVVKKPVIETLCF